MRGKVRIMNKIQENITGQLQSATTAVVDANTKVLDTVVETNRNVVDFAVKAAERFPTIDLPGELPVSLPTPAEAGERYLDFVERAVSMNRELNDRIVAMLPADIKPAAAKKASAKKATASK